MKEMLLAGFIMGVTPAEVTCLADNMYFEARNQGVAGLLAVTNVVMNRVADTRYPDTICEVVQQGPTTLSWKGTGEHIPVKNRCQFSWYCDGKPDEPTDIETYDYIYRLSFEILNQAVPYLDITEGATHYHADYILPAWAASKIRTVEIEDHIFYRWETKDAP
jgi:spore germination cell wall hydrolase CwlJ-like protein|tara:strand:- start:10727 stop:11215 length:489 start_codon:yes stop_codon:yes gene_type:complete